MEKENYYSEEKGLTSSMENYIKAIFMLNSIKGIVRVKDIAQTMNKKMPSVCSALSRLNKMGLVKYEKYEYIELTQEGERVGDQIFNKYHCLSEFFRKVLKIETIRAQEIACKVEHGVSLEVYCRVQKLLGFYEKEKKLNKAWVERQEQCLLD